jgi:molybdopterin-guanine dinucleotide biosynthesis protein B
MPTRKDKIMKKKYVGSDAANFNSKIFESENSPLISPPIISFVGHSGSGKTTFIEKLIPLLINTGLKIAIIKHDAHGFEMDKPGKDTWRHKKAGAVATMISSPTQIGLIMDADHDHQPHELAPLLSFADLIITEGFKYSPYPKLEVFRPEATGDSVPLCLNDLQLLAIVSNAEVVHKVPIFGLEDAKAVAIFLENYFYSLRSQG